MNVWGEHCSSGCRATRCDCFQGTSHCRHAGPKLLRHLIRSMPFTSHWLIKVSIVFAISALNFLGKWVAGQLRHQSSLHFLRSRTHYYNVTMYDHDYGVQCSLGTAKADGLQIQSSLASRSKLNRGSYLRELASYIFEFRHIIFC
jgi:hypothetical protein